MSDDSTFDRRDFLAKATLAGAALGAGALWTGSDKAEEPSPPSKSNDKPELAEKGAASEPSPPSKLPAELREEELVARLDLLKTFTAINFDKLDGQPFEEALRAALAGPPTRIAWMVAPTGTGLGVAARGEGGEFGRSVSDYALRVLGKDRAAVFDRLRMEAPDATMDMEFVLAQPSWFRVGIRLESFEQLRGILQRLRAPTDVLDPMLAHEDIEGARPVWLQMAKPGDTNGRLMAGTRLPAGVRLPAGAENDIVPDHLSSRPVTVDVLADSERRWLRTPGFEGQKLLAWQQARGLDKNAQIRRVGEVQGALDVQGPDWMAWERGKLQKTLVYGYVELL